MFVFASVFVSVIISHCLYVSLCTFPSVYHFLVEWNIAPCPTLKKSESTFTSWPSHRHLECLQLHMLVCVCVMHAPRQLLLKRAGLLCVCLAPVVSSSTWMMSTLLLLLVLRARGEPDKEREALSPKRMMPAWLVENSSSYY